MMENNRKRKLTVEEQEEESSATLCPYLDTINRDLLDFDLEFSCSETLQGGPHIYCCLVCGKYFRGRGPSSPAYTHSVNLGHYVYIHLSTGLFYCLPDNYEIQHPNDLNTLNDIKEVLHPTFSTEEISALDRKDSAKLSSDLFGHKYLPGFIGLNNLNKTDCFNVIIQALVHVKPLRDYFLSSQNNFQNNHLTQQSPLVHKFSQLVRKIWSNKRFKSHVDPHVLVQEISSLSKKKFHIGRQADVAEFISWFLHQLHLGLASGSSSVSNKKKKKKSKKHASIINETFQGRVQIISKVTTTKSKKADKSDNDNIDDRGGSDDEETLPMMTKEEEEGKEEQQEDDVVETITTTESNFLQLTLDMPEKPLYKDDEGGLVIPQEPLVNVLKKFDGKTFTDVINSSSSSSNKKCCYRLQKLPNYLILHLNRFNKSAGSSSSSSSGGGSNKLVVKEKNPTIVSFPLKNLDLSPYVYTSHDGDDQKQNKKIPTIDEIKSMSIKELKDILKKHATTSTSSNSSMPIEKDDLIETVIGLTQTLQQTLEIKYNLIVNITHTTPPEVGRVETSSKNVLQEGTYKCHVQHYGTKQWYEIQDLHVQEIMPQLISLSESYIMIFEKKGL